MYCKYILHFLGNLRTTRGRVAMTTVSPVKGTTVVMETNSPAAEQTTTLQTTSEQVTTQASTTTESKKGTIFRHRCSHGNLTENSAHCMTDVAMVTPQKTARTAWLISLDLPANLSSFFFQFVAVFWEHQLEDLNHRISQTTILETLTANGPSVFPRTTRPSISLCTKWTWKMKTTASK